MLTWPAVSFWFFSRALSRWLPRAMVGFEGGGVEECVQSG